MLLITSEVKGHRHGIYVSDSEDKTIIIGENDDHNHEYEINQISGDIVILPGGEEGHIHEIEKVKKKPPREKKRSNDEIISEVMALRKEAKGLEDLSFREGRESWNFYLGKQWNENIKKQLEINRRAALTINEIQSKVDLLRGHHNQHKTDLLFKPVEDSDENAADIANFIWKNIMDVNGFHYEEDRVFMDQVIAGRGIKQVYIDYSDNFEGDIKIEWYPWDKVRLGPHERMDLRDLEYLIREDKFSKGKLKILFPDHADDIDKFFDSNDIIENDDHIERDIPGQAYRLSGTKDELYYEGEVVADIQRKEVKVFELWKKEYKNVEALILPLESAIESLEGFSKKDIALFKKFDAAETITKNTYDIRIIKIAGNVILSNKLLEYPSGANNFHLFVSYAKKHGHSFQGKVQDVKGIQVEINKRRSQAIDIMNRMAAYGWFYDDDTFWDRSDADKFKNTSSQAGFTVRIKDVGRPPVQIQGVKFPGEIIGMEDSASNKLNVLMGIPPEAAGFGGNDASGRAILLKRRQSLVGNDYLFENLNIANRQLAKTVMALVQAIYTPKRIMRLIKAQPKDALMSANNKNIINVTEDDIIQLLNNEELTKLDLTMSEVTHTESMKDLAFLSMMDLMGTTGPNEVLLKHVIKNSPFPNKNTILEEMGILSQQAAETENRTQIMETLKSQPEEVKLALAQKGILTPEDYERARSGQPQQPGEVQ